MPRHLNWIQENQFCGIPAGSNAFKVALERLHLDNVLLLSYRRENYEVYHCGDHLGCPRKWKLVQNGDHVTVFASGRPLILMTVLGRIIFCSLWLSLVVSRIQYSYGFQESTAR